MNLSILTLEADLSREDQAADTLRLLDAYSADPMGDGHPLSDAARRDLIPGLRQHPTTHVFLAYADGEAVGIAICFLGFSTFAARRLLYIMDYFVQPTHRGRGIGKRLMDAIATRARGTTIFRDVGELRVKESDRLGLIASNILAVGGKAEVVGDDLFVEGTDYRPAGRVVTHADHRIAMAFSVLGTVPGGKINVDNLACAAVSFPGFPQMLRAIRKGR